MVKNVLANFQKECDDYFAIISQALGEGNFKEAIQWFNDLVFGYSKWLVAEKSPGVIITANDPNGQKILVDTNMIKELARARVKMLQVVIKKSRALFKDYDVHIQY